MRSDDLAGMAIDGDRLRAAWDLVAEMVAAADPPMPSAVVLVGRGGRWTAPRAFGRLNPDESSRPLRPDDIFQLASITKPLVALAAVRLVEAGRLGLYDPVARHLPRFANNGKQEVRVVHLLTHTAGLPENLLNNARLRRQLAPIERYVDDAMTAALQHPVGTEFQYSNVGYLVLGELVAQLAGRPLAEELRAAVFRPLGMHDTALGVAGLDESRVVGAITAGTGYDATADWNSPYWRQLGGAWGGAYATAEDLARLAVAALDPAGAGRAVLSPWGWRRMAANWLTSPELPDLAEAARRRERWGLGWRINAPFGMSGPMLDLLGDRVYGHQGITGTSLWIDPDSGGFAVVLTSAGLLKAGWRISRISNALAAALAG